MSQLLIALLEGFSDLARWQKRLVMIALDLNVFAISIWLALYLRLGSWLIDGRQLATLGLIGLALVAPVMWFFGVYRAIFRFVGAGMMGTLFRAYLVYGTLMLLLFGVWGVSGVPRTAGVIQPLLFFALVVGTRTTAGFLLLELLGRPVDNGNVRVALVYGAGSAGQQLVRSLQSERDIRIAGYLDDDRRLAGQKLDGYRIFDSVDLEVVQRETQASTVLLALPGSSRARRREIVDRLSRLPVEVLAVPRISELVDGRVSISDVRPLEIDDLLGREPVAPNEVLLARTTFAKTVMVTGAGGSIGSELCRQILRLRPKRLVLAEMSEHALYVIDRELRENCEVEGLKCEIVTELVNIADGPTTERLFARWRPHTVFHAAAYKHVPLVEGNVIGGMRNNIIGTFNCAQAARATGVSHFILISTDKAVRPTNAMGASKRVCELILQGLTAEGGATRFAMVRFGNVLGSSGSVVPRFLAQIREGGPVTLTHREMTRFFMTIPEAAQLVIQAGAMAEGGEVYLLDMGKPVRIYDLALSMIHLSGLSVRDADQPEGDIEIIEVGLRPGEKLYEELLIDAQSRPTNHSRIMMARERQLPMKQLREDIEAMQRAFAAGDRNAAINLLKKLVPEYRSQISATPTAVGVNSPLALN